jgi:hypothetical protein
MKQLLYKEYRLCLSVQAVVFLSLSLLIVIPTWSALIPFIYSIIGILTIFPWAYANRDMEFTANLPVSKENVVKGRIYFVASLELLSMVWSIPFGCLRQFVLVPMLPAEAQAASALSFNFALYGFVFLSFAVFHLIFFPWYYRKPSGKNIACQLVSTFSAMAVQAAIVALFTVFPEWSAFLDSYTPAAWLTQLAILLGGFILWFFASWIAYRGARRHFLALNL